MNDGRGHEVTELLRSWCQGDGGATATGHRPEFGHQLARRVRFTWILCRTLSALVIDPTGAAGSQRFVRGFGRVRFFTTWNVISPIHNIWMRAELMSPGPPSA